MRPGAAEGPRQGRVLLLVGRALTHLAGEGVPAGGLQALSGGGSPQRGAGRLAPGLHQSLKAVIPRPHPPPAPGLHLPSPPHAHTSLALDWQITKHVGGAAVHGSVTCTALRAASACAGMVPPV